MGEGNPARGEGQPHKLASVQEKRMIIERLGWPWGMKRS